MQIPRHISRQMLFIGVGVIAFLTTASLTYYFAARDSPSASSDQLTQASENNNSTPGATSSPAASPTASPAPIASPSPKPGTPSATVSAQAAVAAQAAAVASLPPAVSSHFGIAAGSSLPSLSAAALNTRMAEMKALGVGWVRYDLEWVNVEPTPGQYNWSTYDRLANAARANGLQVVAIIDYAPSWARLAACSGSFACAPSDPNVYAHFAAVAASRYAPMGIHTWEIWNEENSVDYFKPAADPVRYTAMLKSAYAAIKNVDPSATVITGGLSPADTGDGYYSPPDFINGIYQNGAAGSFTAVGHHPYTYPVTAAYRQPDNAWDQLTQIHNIMAARGDGAKQIWLTEYGAPTGGPGPTATTNDYSSGASHVSESLQAQAVTDLFKQYRTLPWAGPLFWYSYKDAGSSQSTNENFFGLVRADGSHKPSYDAFMQAVINSR